MTLTKRKFSQVFIVADGAVNVEDDIDTSVIIAKGKIDFKSDDIVGLEATCTNAGNGRYDFNMHVYSEEEVAFNSSVEIYATIVGSADKFEIGSTNKTINGLYAEAGGVSNFGSNNNFGGCAGGFDGSFGTFPEPLFGTLRLSLRH